MKEEGSADYDLARLNPYPTNTTESWVVEEDLPSNFYWDLAVDEKGYPAYIDEDKKINWKRDGNNWSTLNGVADKIAFGLDG